MARNKAPSQAEIEQGLYIAYAALTAMAIVPIYFGSFANLRKWKVWNFFFARVVIWIIV